MVAEKLEMYYVLDAQDRIIEVGPGWDAFARANDGADPCAEEVIDQPLMDCVAGPETQQLMRTLFASVRARQQAVSLPFRCDAPDRTRHMEMTLTPIEEQGILVETKLLREEARMPFRALDRRVSRSDEILSVCAWCNRIKLDDAWHEVDNVIQALDLFSQPALPALSHGICSDCVASVGAELS